MKRIGYLALSIVCHAAALASILIFLLFLQGRLPERWLRDPFESPMLAVIVNLAIVALWSLQHTGMASLSFKAWSGRFVPSALERSLYCGLSATALLLIVFGWVPLPATVYRISSPTLTLALDVTFWVVWSLFFISVTLDSYFEFFGLKQAYCFLVGRPFSTSPFKTHHFHRYVRHPSLFFIIVGLWITPNLTLGHLMLAALLTLYTVLGAYSADRKFEIYYGEPYQRQRRDVPLLVPGTIRLVGSRSREQR